jgi:hypothetical protein
MAAGCAPSQTCCYAGTMTAMGPPMGMMAAGPSCVAQGSCQGSSLDCTSTQSCSGGVCCFAYAMAEGGAGGPGLGGAFGGGGMSFTAQCQSQCPMGQYQLCADSSECSGGGNCIQGPYAKYCAAAFDGGGFNFPRGGRDAASD